MKNTINKQGTIFLQCDAKVSVIKHVVSIRSTQIAKRTNRSVECVVLCIESPPGSSMAAELIQSTLSVALVKRSRKSSALNRKDQ
jgi:hypothetical protein